MTKLEFMKELESLLSDIPLEEREEALQYYNGYFEDAGEDHEDEIVKELVSPTRVAGIIKADLGASAADRENRGYFTENGYKDTSFYDEKYEIIGASKKETGSNQESDANSSASEADKAAKQRAKNTNIGIIIIICILASPFITSIFGVIIGLIAAVVGVIIGFGAAGLSMIVAGVALFIAGLIKLSVPFVGLLLCGCGLIVLGLGMLFTQLCVILCKKALPAMIRGTVNLCKMPFKNRSVTA